MTRSTYKLLRTMIRENGWFALKWMDAEERYIMSQLRDIQNQKDWLHERAELIAYCKRQNIPCN